MESYNKKVDDEQDNYEQGWGEDLETAKPLVQFKEGQSTTAIYAVKSLGINPMNGRELFYDLDGNLTYDWEWHPTKLSVEIPSRKCPVLSGRCRLEGI